MDLSWLFWLFIVAQFFVPLYQKQMLEIRRDRSFHGFEQRRKTRLITMIHRQETMSVLGFPLARYIDIEDSEQVLRAIRLTPEDMPIDFLVHTPGGLALAAEQIAFALKRHKGARRTPMSSPGQRSDRRAGRRSLLFGRAALARLVTHSWLFLGNVSRHRQRSGSLTQNDRTRCGVRRRQVGMTLL